MGPPIFIGGNFQIRRFADPLISSFNGATDFHRWKYGWWVGQYLDDFQLQWGHRFSSVEIPAVYYLLAAVDQTSMGPPIFIGGNAHVDGHAIADPVASMGPPIFIGGNGRSVAPPQRRV